MNTAKLCLFPFSKVAIFLTEIALKAREIGNVFKKKSLWNQPTDRGYNFLRMGENQRAKYRHKFFSFQR